MNRAAFVGGAALLAMILAPPGISHAQQLGTDAPPPTERPTVPAAEDNPEETSGEVTEGDAPEEEVPTGEFPLIDVPEMGLGFPEFKEIITAGIEKTGEVIVDLGTVFFSDFGLSYKQVSFDVSLYGGDKTLREMEGDSYVAPFVQLETPVNFFEGYQVGYNFRFGLSSFRVDKQTTDVNEGAVDMGTEVAGSFFYATSVLLINMGDKVFDAPGKGAFRIGIGIGFGYLEAKGDIFLTTLGPGERHVVDVNGFDAAVLVVFEYRTRNGLIRLANGGPTVSKDGFDYQVHDLSFDIAYSIPF